MPVTVSNGEIDFDPARLDKRITWLEPVIGQNAAGSVETWVPGNPPRRTWAEIAPYRGATLIAGGLDVTQTMATVTVRYRPTVATNHRFQAPNGSVFLIQGMQNVLMRNEWLELTCLGIGDNT